MSLLLCRPPGHPVMLLYLHSHLLEHTTKMSSKFASGSLTALETQGDDMSFYIPSARLPGCQCYLYHRRSALFLWCTSIFFTPCITLYC